MLALTGRGRNDGYTWGAWRGRTAYRSMAHADAPRRHAGPGYVYVVLGLSGDPSAAGAVGPLRQHRGVADHRRAAGLRVRCTHLQPREPLRHHLAYARDLGGSARGCDRQWAIGDHRPRGRWDLSALRNWVLPCGCLPAGLQADVHVV